jgi:hypothetical protein
MRGASRAVSRGIGQQVFTPTATPTCPAGQHWVADTPAPIRGMGQIGKCVPNTVLHLALRPPPAPPPPPPPSPPIMLRPAPSAPAGDAFPSPSDGGAGAGPSAGLVCPPPWPWWYLLVAAGLGGVLGFYAERNQKAVRRNAGRVASHAGHRIVHRASDAAVARMLR